MDLHPRLAADCHVLGTTTCGTVLLHRNASVPWFILVPDTSESALYRLPEALRVLVETQWRELAAWVHEHYECDRVNIAAIGNLVPQLHLHVIGRHVGDPCWLGVVWGQPLPERAWNASQLEDLRTHLPRVLGLNAAPKS